MEEAGRQVLDYRWGEKLVVDCWDVCMWMAIAGGGGTYGHQPQETVGCLSRQESQVLSLQHLWKRESRGSVSKCRSG